MTTTSPSKTGPYKGIRFQGKPIYQMGYPELDRLKSRCVAYRAKCKRNGKQPHQHYVTLENAVDFYIDKFTHKGIRHALEQFSTLRRDAQRLGYTVPSIYGNMDIDDILVACAILREAIAAAIPLPGEDLTMTQEMISEMNASLRSAIDELNERYFSRSPFS